MPSPYHFVYFYFYLFGCAGTSLLCEGFLQLRQAGGFYCRASLVMECRLYAGELSSCGMWPYRALRLSSYGSRPLEDWLRSCGAWLSCSGGIWNLPRTQVWTHVPINRSDSYPTGPQGSPLREPIFLLLLIPLEGPLPVILSSSFLTTAPHSTFHFSQKTLFWNCL